MRMVVNELTEGAVFVIPLYFSNYKDNQDLHNVSLDPSGLHAYGRIIEINKATGYLVEIFSYIGTLVEKINGLLNNRLFDPVMVLPNSFKNGRWRIITHTTNFNKDDVNYSEIKLLMGDSPDFELWKGGEVFPIEEDEIDGIEEFIIWRPSHLEERILELI
jgi:hypothetical protein